MKYSKYSNKKVTVDGITFHSKKEAKRYQELILLQKGGIITNLCLQVPITLECNGQKICKYIADFTYEENGQPVVEDVKGFKTDIYKLKKKLVKVLLGIEIREI